MVIRPPRNPYPDDSSQNNKVFTLDGKKFVKKVFTLQNASNNRLSCSMFEPVPEERTSEKMPYIIYMHGNAGNKMEAESYLPKLLKNGINLVAFDFSGCGNSEGEWVTLGWKEKHDLKAVIDYLIGLGTASKIGLWGRSMGAATAIMYMSEHNEQISMAILDSSYS